MHGNFQEWKFVLFFFFNCELDLRVLVVQALEKAGHCTFFDHIKNIVYKTKLILLLLLLKEANHAGEI